MKYKIIDNEYEKIISGEDFNHVFRKSDGLSMTWGRTKEDDPEFCPLGPLLADIEIIKGCNGIRDKSGTRRVCSFCYKANTPNDIHCMSFETFKTIIDKVPKSLGQIAFGADAEATLNPDLFKMMNYCREKNIIPNITVADVEPETAQLLSALCGAVSVSYYPQIDKNRCYDTIDLLANRYAMSQVNIHCLVADFMEEYIYELLEDIKTDPRLKNLNAVVFLSLKQKGRGENFNRMSDENYNKLVDTLLESGINFGFDSCSAFRFLNAVKDHPNYKEFEQMSEPCESTKFSMYINEEGILYPCSFTEKGVFGGEDWNEGIDMTKIDDFIKDVWYDPRVVKVREKITQCGKCHKNCFAFEV